jgi:hypothetical protein
MYENVAMEYVGKVEELLGRRSFRFGDVSLNQVSSEAGVYVIFNEREEIICVGRTGNLLITLTMPVSGVLTRGKMFPETLFKQNLNVDGAWRRRSSPCPWFLLMVFSAALRLIKGLLRL